MMRNYAKFKTQLEKAVRNFNRKIDRQSKQHPEKRAALPKKITAQKFKEIEASIGSKRDFNRTVNRIKRFSKKGAEDVVTNKEGLSVTRWAKNEAARTNAANELRKRARRESIEPSTTTGTMGLAESKEFLPRTFDFENFKTEKEFEKFVDAVEYQLTDKYEQEKLDLYKENYLKAISEQLGDGKIAKQLYDYIEKMAPDKIFKGYNRDVDVKGYRRDFLSINFTYGHTDKEGAASSILDNWQMIDVLL